MEPLVTIGTTNPSVVHPISFISSDTGRHFSLAALNQGKNYSTCKLSTLTKFQELLPRYCATAFIVHAYNYYKAV